MKISYISLRKKIEEYKNNKKRESNKSNIKNKENDDETKFIGINYSKKDKKEKLNVLNNLKKAPRGSYTLIIFMILLLAITTSVNMDTYLKLSKEDYETYTLENKELPVSTTDVIIYGEAVSSVYEVNNNYEEISVETTSENFTQTNKDVLEDEVYVYEYSYIRPVDGETLKEYSMDKVIYSKTLDMWKVHDGIDISAKIGEDVKACEKGKIERIYEDSFYGYSVIIDHGNGIKTIYRNLDSNVLIKENDNVDKAEVIGKVGDTSSGESKDESHLHFEVVQNSEIVNPSIIGIK